MKYLAKEITQILMSGFNSEMVLGWGGYNSWHGMYHNVRTPAYGRKLYAWPIFP